MGKFFRKKEAPKANDGIVPDPAFSVDIFPRAGLAQLAGEPDFKISKGNRLKQTGIVREIDRVKAARAAGDDTEACNFSGWRIEDVDFTVLPALVENPALLTNANFSESTLLGCSFGPVMLPDRTRSHAIAIEQWSDAPSLDLSDTKFDRAHIYKCNFSGVNLSRSDFHHSRIISCRFDLVYTAKYRTWIRTNFDGCRIENCYFRGAEIRGSFLRAEILKSDFTMADLPPFDVKRTDSRLARLLRQAPPVEIIIEAHNQVFAELIEAKQGEIDEFDDDSKKVWRKVITAIRNLADDGAFRIPLRTLVRTRLDQSIFENAVIYSCAFRGAWMERRVNFDHALLLKTDFRPARIEEIPWQYAIISTILQNISETVTQEEMHSIDVSLRALLRQLAERIEDEATILARESKFDNKGGRVVTRISTASFDRISAGDVHFSYAMAARLRMSGSLVSDCFFENADYSGAHFDESVFKRTTFDGANLSQASAVHTRFDGDLVDSHKIMEIERKREEFDRRSREAELEFTSISKKGGAKHDDNDAQRETENNDVKVDGEDYGPDQLQRPTAGAVHEKATHLYEQLSSYCKHNEALREALRFISQFYQQLKKDMDEDAMGAESGERVSAQGASESCSFYQTNLEEIDATGASFKVCMLENAMFRGGVFERNENHGAANFDYAFLRGANFERAKLEQVSFSGATLTGMTGLNRALSLHGANFFDSRGLRGTEFAGADLTGVVLPVELESFGGILSSVADLTRQARILFATLMFVCAYSILSLVNISNDVAVDHSSYSRNNGAQSSASDQVELSAPQNSASTTSARNGVNASATVAQTKDEELTVSTKSIIGLKLPVIGIEVTKSIFFIAGPALILAFYLMFHLKYSRIWLEAKRLPYRFPDGRPVDRHLFPWIFASLVPGFLGSRSSSKGSWVKSFRRKIRNFFTITSMEQIIALILGWFVAPLAISGFVLEIYRIRNGQYIGDEAPDLQFMGVDTYWITGGVLGIVVFITIISLMQLFRIPPFGESPTRVENADTKKNDVEESSVGGGWQGLWGRTRGVLGSIASRLRKQMAKLIRNIRGALGITAAAAFAFAVAFTPVNMPFLLKAVAQKDGDWLLTSTIISGADFIGASYLSIRPRALEYAGGSKPFSRRNISFLLAEGQKITHTDFSSSVLTRPYFSSADLSHSDFSKAVLIFADFKSTDISNTSFRSAVLLSVDFSGAVGASDTSFEGACANEGTILPEGIHSLPDCTTVSHQAVNGTY